jgi:type IV secretory pathway VirJ component
MNKFFLIVVFVFSAIAVTAQQPDISKLPLSIIKPKKQIADLPLIIYISGDGGENTFSTDIVNRFALHGYPIVILNSLKYFWKKKDPAQAAADLEKIISVYRNEWKRSKICLVGYSMGAGVLPFMYTRLSAQTQALVSNVVFISPSNNTDFEVHLSSLFANDRGQSVPEEISKILRHVIILQGKDENEKMETTLLDRNRYLLLVLKGGHHYNADPDMVVNKILENLK